MAVMTIEPVKSQQDQKSYKRLKLDNGLDVMLIHDPEMEASSSGDADAEMTTDDDHDRDGSSLQVSCGIIYNVVLQFRCNRHMCEAITPCRDPLRRMLRVAMMARHNT